HWAGSAFALNLFKSWLASAILAGILAFTTAGGLGQAASLLDRDAGLALCLSSLVGIVVGDTAWLASIRRPLIGARRVLLVDSLKPFIAAAAGGFVFREEASVWSLASMALAVAGVLMVSLEREGPRKEAWGQSGRRRLLGYVLALLTVALDVVGAVLTKGFGTGLSPWASRRPLRLRGALPRGDCGCWRRGARGARRVASARCVRHRRGHRRGGGEHLAPRGGTRAAVVPAASAERAQLAALGGGGRVHDGAVSRAEQPGAADPAGRGSLATRGGPGCGNEVRFTWGGPR
ncbi:unnamed protein product, partial [Prorocentrum cordatum]